MVALITTKMWNDLTRRVQVLELRQDHSEIMHKLEAIMASLDETLAAVTETDTKLDGITALIAGLKAQLDEALAGTTLTPAVQAKVDAIFAQAEKNNAEIDAALEANT